MTNTETKTYRVTVIERGLVRYDVEAEDARAAAETWDEGRFVDADDQTLESEGPTRIRELQPDGTWRTLALSEWAAAAGDGLPKPFSVLLLYPDWLNDSGYETYYAFVTATDAVEAVSVAQAKAAAAQLTDVDEPAEFRPLLVTQGHHHGEPLFDK